MSEIFNGGILIHYSPGLDMSFAMNRRKRFKHLVGMK